MSKMKVEDLREGDLVDLQYDDFADPKGDRIDFECEFQIVETVEFETPECVRVDFESGFSCGFPFGHLVEVDNTP